MFGLRGKSISQSVVSSNGYTTITINGESTTIKGDNVSIINNKIFINGKEYKVRKGEKENG